MTLLLRLGVLALALFIGAGMAHGQGARKVYRIGVVSPGAPPPGPLAAFTAGLREHGYVEGRNVQFEWRFAEGRNERLPSSRKQGWTSSSW